MKIGLCSYSGYKIYPGHGTTVVKADGKLMHFLNARCERAQAMRRNPRRVTWTVLYRRKHKKGQEEETHKKRSRRTQKFQRAIVGASITEILAKRNMKPDVRKTQQREQAIKQVKDKKKAGTAAGAAQTAGAAIAAAAAKKMQKQQKAVRIVQKSAPKIAVRR